MFVQTLNKKLGSQTRGRGGNKLTLGIKQAQLDSFLDTAVKQIESKMNGASDKAKAAEEKCCAWKQRALKAEKELSEVRKTAAKSSTPQSPVMPQGGMSFASPLSSSTSAQVPVGQSPAQQGMFYFMQMQQQFHAQIAQIRLDHQKEVSELKERHAKELEAAKANTRKKMLLMSEMS